MVITDIRKEIESIGSPAEVKSAMKRVFKRMEFTDPEIASIYYLYSILDDYNIHQMTKYAEVFEPDQTVSRPLITDAREELHDRGIIAQIFFSNNAQEKAKEKDFGAESFFPVSPITLWKHEYCKNHKISNVDNEYFKIIEKFEKEVYVKRFGLKSELMDKNYCMLYFNSMWFIYLLLAYVKKNSEISMLLSGLRTPNTPHGNYYEDILKEGATIFALFDKRDEDQIKRATKLAELYPEQLKVRYNYKQLYGTSRRILLKDVFANDVIKIMPPEKKVSPLLKDQNSSANENIFYVGVFYTDQNIRLLQRSFQQWWELGTELGKMPSKKTEK
jgi:hypothetical protein